MLHSVLWNRYEKINGTHFVKGRGLIFSLILPKVKPQKYNYINIYYIT